MTSPGQGKIFRTEDGKVAASKGTGKTRLSGNGDLLRERGPEREHYLTLLNNEFSWKIYF